MSDFEYPPQEPPRLAELQRILRDAKDEGDEDAVQIAQDLIDRDFTPDGKRKLRFKRSKIQFKRS